MSSFIKVGQAIGKAVKTNPGVQQAAQNGVKLKIDRTGQGKVFKKVTNTGNTGTAAVNVNATKAASAEQQEDMRQRLKKSAATLGTSGGRGVMDGMKKSLLGE